MDYRYLQAFLLVAELKSFTAAAVKMKVAQSAVSRQIRLFEESCGQELFVRSKKLVLLTPAGEALARKAREFELYCSIEFHQAVPEVRIGIIQGALDGWLRERLTRLKPPFDFNLNIRVMDDGEIATALAEGRIDLGITTMKIDNETVVSRRLFDEEMVLISAGAVDVKRIHERCWISGQRGRYLSRLSKKAPSRHIKVNSVQVIQDLVAAGYGIAVLPEHALRPGLKVRKTKLRAAASSIYLLMPNYRKLPEHLKKIVMTLDKSG